MLHCAFCAVSAVTVSAASPVLYLHHFYMSTMTIVQMYFSLVDRDEGAQLQRDNVSGTDKL